FMILAAEFESFAHPFVVLLTVPLAIVGASLSLFVAGAGINVMSLIGLIILVGIVDNDAVVAIDYINQLRGRGLAVREAIVQGGLARMRPILMTTATTLLGVLPMALGLGRGGELQAPLAITVLGGLFTATALTLIVIPVLYELVERVRQRARARLGLAPDARASWLDWVHPGRQGERATSGAAPARAPAPAPDR
ncbi:MAG: efflux RND transporter permease subunit, partial [Longimicrobiales bacterium]